MNDKEKFVSEKVEKPLFDIDEVYGIILKIRILDVREIILVWLMDQSFMNSNLSYGNTLVCGFAKIHGYKVNSCKSNGILFSESAC